MYAIKDDQVAYVEKGKCPQASPKLTLSVLLHKLMYILSGNKLKPAQVGPNCPEAFY